MLVSKAAPRASSASGSAGVLLPTSKADAQTLARAAVAAAESASAAAHQVLGVLIYSTYSGHASFLFLPGAAGVAAPESAAPAPPGFADAAAASDGPRADRGADRRSQRRPAWMPRRSCFVHECHGCHALIMDET